MKQQVSPGVMALVLGIVVVVVVIIGFRMLGSKSYQADKAGGQKEMDTFKQTGQFYKPPEGIVPGSRSGGPPMGLPTGPPGGGGGTGYNLNPPNR